MKQVTATILVAIVTAMLLTFTAATTRSVFAQQANPQGTPQTMQNPKTIEQQVQQLFTTGTAKIGNNTLQLGRAVLVTLRLGGVAQGSGGAVLVTPLTCINVSGNQSGQSMMSLSQVMKQHPPSACFSAKDAMFIKSSLMRAGSLGGMIGGR